MKARTKENLGYIFGGLFSNQKAINGAKHNAWWVALIMFILGVILPVVPLTVTVANSYGSSFLAANTYGYEDQITEASLNLYNDGYKFEVVENNGVRELKGTLNGSDITSDETKPIYEVKPTSGSQKGEISFQVYYSERTFTKSNNIKDLVDNLVAKRYITGSTLEPSTDVEATESADSEVQETYYRPSFILLFRGGSYEYIAKPQTYEVAANQSGDWKNTEVGTNLLERVLTVEGYKLPTNDSEIDTLVRDTNYVNGVLNNWKQIYNESYLATKNSALLYQSLLFLGIYAILVLFMGLMVFLLTRGKRNSFNYLTFWTCEKIAMWASLSPGLLAMILGFMLPSYAVMFFIILVGIRIMWLSMKQLRPTYN